MRAHLKWLVGTSLMATALVLGPVATTASAATTGPSATARPFCILDDYDNDCLQTVNGTATPSIGLNIHSSAGTSYSVVGTMPYNGTGTVYCYTTGDTINNDPYWAYLNSAWGDGYVAATFLNTGGDISHQVDHC